MAYLRLKTALRYQLAINKRLPEIKEVYWYESERDRYIDDYVVIYPRLPCTVGTVLEQMWIPVDDNLDITDYGFSILEATLNQPVWPRLYIELWQQVIYKGWHKSENRVKSIHLITGEFCDSIRVCLHFEGTEKHIDIFMPFAPDAVFDLQTDGILKKIESEYHILFGVIQA